MDIPLRPEEIRSGLATQRVGKTLHYFPEIDSTNVRAQQLARSGAAEGEVVIADAQTRGKGRLGRSWVSPPNLNLYLSVIFRPKLDPIDAPKLTLMSAVALAESVKSFGVDTPEIKWPNDIQAGGKKLAGILTEACCETERIVFVVVGIGVNLNYPRDAMPHEIRETATSIVSLTGKPVKRESFARRLIQNLDQCYGDLYEKGFAVIADRWETFFHLRGKRIKVGGRDGWVSGKALGLDADGALLLEDEHGHSRRVIAGDVIPLE